MLRVILDQSKCVGCRVCEAVCSLVHEGESNPTKSRIKLIRKIEDSLLHTFPVFCLHCEDPYCAEMCPVHAINRDERGAMVVDEDKCIGCTLCEIVCPAGAIAVHPEKQISLKCDLCAGLDMPQCVKYCFSEALQFLPAERVGITRARAKSEKFLEMQGKEVQHVTNRYNTQSRFD
jgi:Fe-S-cluster-containing hydrogenase component 2